MLCPCKQNNMSMFTAAAETVGHVALQMGLEYTENKRLAAQEAASSSAWAAGGTSSLEKGLVRGNRASRAQTVVPTAFETWVSSELKIEANEAKAARKRREELRFEAERLEALKKAAPPIPTEVVPPKKK